MASLSMFLFLLLFHFIVLLVSSGYGNGKHDQCPKSFDCGQFKNLHFPFTKPELQHCGFITIRGCDDPSPNKTIQLDKNGRSLLLKKVLQQHTYIITVFDEELHQRLRSRTCEAFNTTMSMTLPPKSPLASFHVKHNATLFRCKHDQDLDLKIPDGFINRHCPGYDFYCEDSQMPHPTNLDLNDKGENPFSKCSVLQFPCKHLVDFEDPSSFSCDEIDIEVNVSDICDQCYSHKGGRCLVDPNNHFYCDIDDGRLLKLGFGLQLGGLVIGLVAILIIIWWLQKHYKQRYASSNNNNVQRQSQNRNAIVGNNSNADLESGLDHYFAIPLFSYEELEKATNKFDRSRELGNGGFGTVYYGKLDDGREVAVKRLNDHNYQRKKQFMNELNIITRLRHRYLVSLYGCTSCHSCDLLLVYEYIPNGTLSCHLHDNRNELSTHGFLPWSVRIKIAIETAAALAYLHASDTIHRDVKTNNILLDNNFSVKVADFGLSRLFPNDVTHVSTGPQGTPGYVDPEYYQCYQLTDKSDVYSFGVVLIELISSLPAVDIQRNKDEVTLANLAMKKIQKSAFGELVDHSLGFESNNKIRKMIISVAELAFQCLQGDKELRPSMDKVLEILRKIESGKVEQSHVEEVDIHGVYVISHSGPIHPPSPPSPDCNEAILMKTTKSQ